MTQRRKKQYENRFPPEVSHALVLFCLVFTLGISQRVGAQEVPSEPAGDDALQVVVGPGARSLEPVAVPEALCAGASLEACERVTSTIRRDLNLSFFFKLLSPRSYLVADDALGLDEVSWTDWTNVGARFLVKAEVRGPGPYSLKLRVYNVTTRSLLAVEGQDKAGVKGKDLVRATKKFLNGMIKVITGVPGIFDTKIAFATKISPGVKAISVMEMDGANKHALISNGSINMLPAWGFGGVFYTSFLQGKPEIYFNKKKISRDTGHYRKVAVSPDGSNMVASISYGGQSDLFMMAKDGTIIRNLTNTASDEVSPTFSPDGSKVAFVSSATGGPQIYMMHLSSTSMKRLTHEGSYNFSPDWGRSGLVVFAGMEDGGSDIFTVNEAGAINRLTQRQGKNKDPTWSPDGRYIAFISQRKAGTGIWLMSSDGRYQRLITKGGGRSNPAWQK